MTIAVAGAIDVDEINARLVDLFGDWAAADVPEVKQMQAITRSRAALHHFPAKKLQSWLVIGHDLPPVPPEEQAAFEVMDYIMGAYHLNTRMMRETAIQVRLHERCEQFCRGSLVRTGRLHLPVVQQARSHRENLREHDGRIDSHWRRGSVRA